MTDELKFGLTDIEVGDDLDVSMDNETYQDQANPAPPATGIYNLKALSLQPRRNKEQEIILDRGYPIFTIGMAEIVEGLGDGVTRKFGLFHDVKTRPFDRYGTLSSGIGDLTRAYGTRNWKGLRADDPDSGISVLKEAFEQGFTFAVTLDWEGYDKEFVAAAREQLSIPEDAEDRDDDQKKVLNAIYNTARVRGMKFFPFNESTGRFIPVLGREVVRFQNPVTNAVVAVEGDYRTLEAKPVITRFYAKSEVESGRVRFGPFNVKPAQLKLVA